MLGLQSDAAIGFANLVGAGILGILAAFGLWWGKRSPTPKEKTFEVAGALVDPGAVTELAAAIREYNEDANERAKASRAVGHKMVETGEKLAYEMRELRGEIRHFGDTMKR